jgi:uncharacterized protein DUF5025
MKFLFNRTFALTIISSAFLLAVTSCSKSNNGGSSNRISATVSGTAWANSSLVAGIFSATAGAFEIGGAQYKGGDSTLFALTFVSPITLNKVMVADGVTIDVGYIDAKTAAIYDGSTVSGGNGHSTVIVTSYDSTGHKIAGTFSGVLYNEQNASDSVVITNGSFNTSFTAQ